MRSTTPYPHDDITDEGPPICAGLSPRRDSAAYFDHKPTDHDAVGLFVGGPRGEKVGWLRDVETGALHTAPAHETREAAFQRMDETQRRKWRRLGLALAGARIPPVRASKRAA